MLVVVVLALAGRLLDFYVDWLWFGEVGFRSVFWTAFWSRLVLGLAAGALFFVIVCREPRDRPAAVAGVPHQRRRRRRRAEERGRARHAGAIGLVVAAIVSIFAGVAASSAWMTFRKALDATAFGVDDPLFGHDLGFYVFSVPAWHAVQNFVLVRAARRSRAVGASCTSSSAASSTG